MTTVACRGPPNNWTPTFTSAPFGGQICDIFNPCNTQIPNTTTIYSSSGPISGQGVPLSLER